jgi:hypothetical protein
MYKNREGSTSSIEKDTVVKHIFVCPLIADCSLFSVLNMAPIAINGLSPDLDAASTKSKNLNVCIAAHPT